MNSTKIVCQVKIFWKNNLIHVAQVYNNQTFTVGETTDCNYSLPTNQLNTDKITLVSYLNNTITVNTLTQEKTLNIGESTKFSLLDFNIEINADHQNKINPVFNLDKKGLSFIGLSLVSHIALLLSMFFYMPQLTGEDDEERLKEQQILMSQYLSAIAEKEHKEEIEDNKTSTGGDIGSRAKGSEGVMGNSLATGQRKYSLAGPKNNPDPHISRQAALKEAAEFGIIGLLNAGAGGDPNAPTAPWGRDTSLGNDALNANGSLWGLDVGESFGNGIGLSGIGEGGGGPGEGIGLNKIGGLGNSLSQGFGPSRKLADNHTVKNIVMRSGTTISSGRIPPEIIQRIIRQNFGRFRSCYEAGLRNNPNLSGRVGVRFVISREGAVMQTSNGGSDLPDSGVVNCVVGSFRGLSFPPTEGGIVTVTYSIQFSPS